MPLLRKWTARSLTGAAGSRSKDDATEDKVAFPEPDMPIIRKWAVRSLTVLDCASSFEGFMSNIEDKE